MSINQSTVQEITKRFQEASKLCDSSLNTMRLNERFGLLQVYTRLVGKFMGYVFANVLAPIWKKYPELEPKYMKEPYIEPVPTLTIESQNALRAFLVEARATMNYVKSNIGLEESKQLFAFGGMAEIEDTIEAIELFLEKPRFRDTKEK